MSVGVSEEILVGERDFDSIFTYTAGITRSKFLTEIRDNRTFVGTKCDSCNIVWVPARSTCAKCFGSLKEFVKVGDAGTVTSYTIVNNEEACYVMKPPFVLGIIQLDGASTGLVHFIGEIRPEDMRVGMRVRAVFNEDRRGSVLDVKYFKPEHHS
jgi:uncharacterized OB-fold protein